MFIEVKENHWIPIDRIQQITINGQGDYEIIIPGNIIVVGKDKVKSIEKLIKSKKKKPDPWI